VGPQAAARRAVYLFSHFGRNSLTDLGLDQRPVDREMLTRRKRGFLACRESAL
jgi:hypothetical protein